MCWLRSSEMSHSSTQVELGAASSSPPTAGAIRNEITNPRQSLLREAEKKFFFEVMHERILQIDAFLSRALRRFLGRISICILYKCQILQDMQGSLTGYIFKPKAGSEMVPSLPDPMQVPMCQPDSHVELGYDAREWLMVFTLLH